MKTQNNRPPQWPIQLLRFFIREDYMEEIEGDMEERFQDNLKHLPLRKVRWLFVLDTLKLLRPALLKKILRGSLFHHFGLFLHYAKISWRQTLNHKLFSVNKIGGFAVGIATCILITLYISHQTSYDRHYEAKDRIYRLINQWSESGEIGYWSNVHGPLKILLEDHIPEMEQVARVVLWTWGDAGDNHIRRIESAYQNYEEGFLYADPELLDILDIAMVYGTRSKALVEPNSMVITRTKAEKYFPGQNPVGKQMILNDNPESSYTIGGVIEDFPTTSHLNGHFILTLVGRKQGPGTSGWCCTNYNMYTRLTPSADKLIVEEKTRELRNTHVIPLLKDVGASGLEESQQYQSYYLQPVENIYLNPEEVEDDLAHGSIALVWIFGSIAAIVLILACLNFVNLSTAHAMNRAKEVGLRKVVGSFRSHLIYQYLLESCLYTLFAVIIGALFAEMALPLFNELAGVSLRIPWLSLWFFPLLLSITFIIGLLSGIYPSFYLSAFKPIDVLKGRMGKRTKSSWMRSGIIVFQFAATVVLIAAGLVTHQQFQLFMNKSLGYDKEQVINILGLETMNKSERQVLKAELLKLSEVNAASVSDFIPVNGGAIQNRSFWLADRRKLDHGMEAAYWWVDEDYLETMAMELISGRNFRSGDSDADAIIINERMARVLALEEPIDKKIIDMFDQQYTVIGVVKDFYFESLFDEVRPLAMVKGDHGSMLSLKIGTDNLHSALASIENLWTTVEPNQSLRYRFLDERFKHMYEDLNRAKTIFLLFSGLSMIIACSGLFALSFYLIGQRGREVSIRKVLGASISRIFWLLSADFVKLVLVAILVAIPLAWQLMDYFLEDLANRVELSWSTFALAGWVAFVITLATVSLEAVRAAHTNPAEKLRNES